MICKANIWKGKSKSMDISKGSNFHLGKKINVKMLKYGTESCAKPTKLMNDIWSNTH